MKKEYTIEDVVARVENHHVKGGKHYANCPLCGATKEHFNFTDKGGKLLMNCFKCGGTFKDFLSVLFGDDMRQGADVKRQYMKKYHKIKQAEPENHGELVEDIGYEYTDIDDNVVYAKRRMKYADGHKDFCFYHYSKDNGAQFSKPKDIQDKLFNLGCLMLEPNTDILFIVEGEKCACAVIKAGYPATTSDTGCGGNTAIKFGDNDRKAVSRYKRVVVIPDNDAPGQRYVQSVLDMIPTAIVVNLPDVWPECKEKDDIADYLEGGGSMGNILAHIPKQDESAENTEIEVISDKLYTEPEFYGKIEDPGKLLQIARVIARIDNVYDREMARTQALVRAGALRCKREFSDIYKLELQQMAQARAKELSINTTSYSLEEAPLGVKNLLCGEYHATDDGVSVTIFKTGQEKQIFHTPVTVSARTKNIDDQVEHVTLNYLEKGEGWKSVTCERIEISDSRRIVNLSNIGLPVDSNTAKDAVGFLNKLININPAELRLSKSVGHLGYCGPEAFLPYCNPENIAIDNQQNFREVVSGLDSKGSRDKSLKQILKLRKNLKFRLYCDAALSGLILEKTRALPFITHLYGGTGAGKTVALMAVMSMFGNPKKLMVSINSTANALMERAVFLRNFPYALDELQTVADKKYNTTKIIMQLTEGVNKQKMANGSEMRQTGRWLLPILTNGEQDIVNDKAWGGALNRVLSIECDGPVVENGHEVIGVIEENYGYIAEEYVKHFMKHAGHYEAVYHEFLDAIIKENKEYPEKQLSIIAAIMVADVAFIECFGTDEEMLEDSECIKLFLKKNSQIDVAERAWEYISNIVAANLGNFEPINEKRKSIAEEHWHPVSNWWGAVCRDTGKVYFLRDIFYEKLEENSFPFSACRSKWASSGRLEVNGKNYCQQTTLCGKNKTYYAVLNLDFNEQADDSMDVANNSILLQDNPFSGV